LAENYKLTATGPTTLLLVEELYVLDVMTAFYMIELPSCLLEGSHMLISADPRKLLHIFAL